MGIYSSPIAFLPGAGKATSPFHKTGFKARLIRFDNFLFHYIRIVVQFPYGKVKSAALSIPESSGPRLCRNTADQIFPSPVGKYSEYEKNSCDFSLSGTIIFANPSFSIKA
jgi:hypothetical protein